MFALIAGGAIATVYDKWHLVPCPARKYVPDWLPLPIMVLPGNGFAPGPGPQTLHVPGLPPVGALICYEAIFTGQIVDPNEAPRVAGLHHQRRLVRQFQRSAPASGGGAHARAVEEGLPLMRAANTGISAAFDARGHELGRIGMQTAGTLVVPLPPPLPATPFARWGLLLPGMASTVALGIGLMARRNAAQG